MKIGILKKGDSVLFVNEQFIAIQRKNGEVDLIPLSLNDTGLPILVTENIVTITYGDNTVEVTIDGEAGDISITTF